MACTFTKNITTSITVDLSAPEDALLKFEIDGDADQGFNCGNTTFYPGDTVFFAECHSADVTDIKVSGATSGGSSTCGKTTRCMEEYLTFSNSKEVTLSYPPDSTPTPEKVSTFYDSQGNESGDITFKNSKYNTKIIASKACYGMIKVSYQYTVKLYSLSTEYNIDPTIAKRHYPILVIGKSPNYK